MALTRLHHGAYRLRRINGVAVELLSRGTDQSESRVLSSRRRSGRLVQFDECPELLVQQKTIC